MRVCLLSLVASCLGSIPLPTQVAEVPRELAQDIQVALDRSRPALLHHLEVENQARLALMVLAAVHDQIPFDSVEMQGAFDRLSRAQIDDTYGLALRLMVMAHVADFPDRERLSAADTRVLLSHRVGKGFGYSPRPSNWDLSNTQYAVLGLRAAVHMGQDVPSQVWKQLLATMYSMQRRDGGFGYQPGQDSTPSMTVAGIAVIELARQQLDLGDDDSRCSRALQGGWRWMVANRGVIGSGQNGANLYFHYGLERAAILSGREEVGDVHWYPTGAQMILTLQNRRGGFETSPELAKQSDGDGGAVDTAFAILFLRRAFQRDLRQGPTTQGPTPLCHQLPAEATADDVRRAIALDVARGVSAMTNLLEALRSDLEVRRRAAIQAVIRITGSDFRYHPDRAHADNAAALTRLEQWIEQQRR